MYVPVKMHVFWYAYSCIKGLYKMGVVHFIHFHNITLKLMELHADEQQNGVPLSSFFHTTDSHQSTFIHSINSSWTEHINCSR